MFKHQSCNFEISNTIKMEKQKWSIDPAHTNIEFKAKHLMITTVRGSFSQFSGSVISEGQDLSTASFSFEAEVASINTGNTDRDNHLRSEDFFNAEAFPKLSFKGEQMKAKGGDTYELKGELQIRDVTRPISLLVEIAGVAKDPWGQTKAGLSFKGKLNRKDYGLKFHVVNEAGNLLVSDEISLEGEVQLTMEAAETA